jgi:hypothetical protein
MENQKPELFHNQSVISVVSELHSYFRNLQSEYKIVKSRVISKLEVENDRQKQEQLKTKLKTINQKIEYFHVLNNAVSIADVVLHTEEMVKEFQ